MNNNKVVTLDALEPQLKHISTLETVYLEGNPVQKKEGTAYRRKVILALPQVKQIDATCVPVPPCPSSSPMPPCSRSSRYVKQF